MATCKQSAAELIQDVFSPCVAVLCSSDVEAVCSKNNLTFVEMIQPFCRLNTEITVRDPSNVAISIRNLRINMKDMTSLLPPSNVGKKVMHDAVSNNSTEGVLCNSVNDDVYNIKYSASTPWFEAYREVYFQVVAPTEHEFMHHYLSCIFVVSSSCPDPLNQIHQLCQEQQQCQLQNSHHNTRWFFTCIFKYYLLLHDTASENLAKAEAIYQSMKSCYGASVCHLLQINSSSTKEEFNSLNSHEEMNGNLPDPWSQFLSKYYIQQETNEELVKNDVIETNLELKENSEGDVEGEIENCVADSNERTIIKHPLLNSSEDITAINDSSNETPKKDGTKSSVYSGWGRSCNRNKKHGLCLSLSDMDRIRVFVQEFCIQGLVPFVEKNIRILTDQVANRKSIHRTLFGVTKKLFTANKPGIQGPVASTNSVVYGHDAPELQVRKLGDLSFMFQLYEVAYQAYHTAKRDFSGEAWLHFAGASEMAALSVFMQKASNLQEYPARYMEAAITTYLYTCKLPELAIRATLLSTECLKTKGLYKEAAIQFSRILTEADLPSALLLEQSAHCAVNCKPPYVRKYMFNLILAGHRFSKCGQRKHSLRAYRQVEQAYDQLGWNASRNHIKSLIGRTSLHLKQVENAYNAFHQLLSTQSEQASVDQSHCLRDYLIALKEYLFQQAPTDTFQLQCLPIPIIDCQMTKVLLGQDNYTDSEGHLVVNGRGFEHGDIENESWAKLEEMMIASVGKVVPPIFTPQLYCFTDSTNNISQPTCIADEKITMEVYLKNPLGISFSLDSLFLLWTFSTIPDSNSNKDPVNFSNELDVSKIELLNSVVETQVLPQLVLEPFQERKLHLTVKPMHQGSLLIRGLSYKLRGPLAKSGSSVPQDFPSLQGKYLIDIKGPRLNKTAAERATKSYANDNRLNLRVLPSMARLQVRYSHVPETLFCGEIQHSVVELTNKGSHRLQKIVVASATPSLFVIGQKDQAEFPIYREVPCLRHPVSLPEDWIECDWKTELKTSKSEPCGLDPGDTVTLSIWFRSPDLPGKYNLKLLYYYETDLPDCKLQHRLVQHSFSLHAKSSLSVQAKGLSSQISSEGDSYGANSLLLSLVAANASEELSEISVVQISSLSPVWHFSSTEDLIPKSLPVIKEKECMLLTLKVSCIQQSQEADSSRKKQIFSHVPLSCFEVDTASSPCIDFINKSRIKPEFLSSVFGEDYDMLNSQNVVLLLLVIWKAKVEREGFSQVIMGQHHLRIENFNIDCSSTKSSVLQVDHPVLATPAADQYVQCMMVHPFHIWHNFKLKRMVIVPVEFVVQNTCNLPLRLLLDNSDHSLNRSMPYSIEESQAPMAQLFSWVNGSKKIIELEPKKTVKVKLNALFCNPGTYNLGCLNVKVMRDGDTVINYIMSPFIIVISACNSTSQ